MTRPTSTRRETAKERLPGHRPWPSSVDQPVEELEGVVRLTDVPEVAVVADDLGATEPFEHGAPLLVVAAVRVPAGVDEVEVADMGPDRRPVVGVLEDGFLLG